MTWVISAILLFAVQDLDKAIGAFDVGFEAGSKEERQKLVRALGKYDQTGAADRLAKTCALVDKDLGAYRADLEGQDLPLDNPNSVRIPLLLGGFYDKDAETKVKILDLESVRTLAITLLRGFREKETLDWMFTAVKASEEAGVREGLAHALTGIDDPRVDPALLDRVTKDEAWEVRAAAMSGLALRASRYGVDAIKRAIGDEAWQLRYGAILSIPDASNPQLTPVLIRALKDQRWEIRFHAVMGLGKTEDLTTVRALLPTLKDESGKVRMAALKVVGRLGTRAIIPAVAPLMNDEVEEIRAYAVEAIATAGQVGAIPTLVAALRLPHPDVVKNARQQLEGIGHPLAVSGMIEVLLDKAVPEETKTGIRGTLTLLTGENHSKDKAWKSWWDRKFRKAAGEYDGQFSRGEALRRLELINAIAPHDRKETADRLLKALSLTERGLAQFIMQKNQLLQDQQKIPDWGDPNDLAAQKWIAYFKKQEELQLQISQLELVRFAAVEALSNLNHAKTIEALIKKLARSRSPLEAQSLANALSRGDPKRVVPALLARMEKEKNWEVKVAVIQSLAQLQAGEAKEVLVAALSDKMWNVRLAAMLALEQILGAKGVGPLVSALEAAEGRLKHEIFDALVRLTGIERSTKIGWQQWWKVNEENFLTGKPRDDSAGTETAEPPRLPTFYGHTVNSKRVIFILDRSYSMEDPISSGAPPAPPGFPPGIPGVPPGLPPGMGPGIPPGGPPSDKKRIDAARDELKQVIKILPEDTLFNVLTYSDGVRPWKQTLVKASKSNKSNAINWFTKIPPNGGTNTFDAIDMAFNMTGPGGRDGKQGADTIFLVSDGTPTAGRIQVPGLILAEVRRLNQNRRVRINTVAVGDGFDTDSQFMLRLAADNHGRHVWRK